MKITPFKYKALAGYLFLVAATVLSCKKLIEIPPNPPNQIPRAIEFADSASTISAVLGVYSDTYGQGQGTFAYGDAFLTKTTGLSAHELNTTLAYDDQPQFYNYTLTGANNVIPSLWKLPYQGIYTMNDILTAVGSNRNLSASFKKQITGEMKTARAFYYFNLVNLFGGVPLVTTTDQSVTSRLPRASVNAVYAQIIADLNDALNNLVPAYPSAGKLRPNFYTAQALLAKVHLYRGNWQAAYNEADSVIKSGLYDVSGTPLSGVFLDGSREAIWQIPVLSAYQGVQEVSLFVPFANNTTPNYPVTDSLVKQFDAGDQRFKTWLGTNVVTAGGSTNTVYYPFKYKQRAPGTPREDFMIFRLGEMYLIRAEAAAQLNSLSAALADINILRARAGLGASTANATSQSAVLNAVMHERRTELCFEWGNLWFDLNRTGKAASVLSGFQSYNAVYPVPQGEILLNSSLIQNPGYN